MCWSGVGSFVRNKENNLYMVPKKEAPHSSSRGLGQDLIERIKNIMFRSRNKFICV